MRPTLVDHGKADGGPIPRQLIIFAIAVLQCSNWVRFELLQS